MFLYVCVCSSMFVYVCVRLCIYFLGFLMFVYKFVYVFVRLCLLEYVCVCLCMLCMLCMFCMFVYGCVCLFMLCMLCMLCMLFMLCMYVYVCVCLCMCVCLWVPESKSSVWSCLESSHSFKLSVSGPIPVQCRHNRTSVSLKHNDSLTRQRGIGVVYILLWRIRIAKKVGCLINYRLQMVFV